MKNRTVVGVLAALALLALPFAAGADTIDLDGATLRLQNHWGWTYAPYIDGGAEQEWREWVEQEFNVKIEFSERNFGTFADDLRASVLNGDPIVDIFRNGGIGETMQLARADVILPVDDVLPADYFDRIPSFSRNYAEVMGSYDGRIYGVNMNHDAIFLGVVFNKTLLEREGLPSPYDLMDAGEWDFDAFKEIALKATRDADGDGEIDQWGLTFGQWGHPEPHVLQRQAIWFAMANGASVVEEQGGSKVFALNDSRAVEAVDLLAELNAAGAIRGASYDQVQLFFENNVAMGVIDANWMEHFVNPEKMSEPVGLVPLPMGPQADAHIYQRVIGETFLIPRNSKLDPAAVIEVFSALYKVMAPYADVEQVEADYYERWDTQFAGDEQTSQFLRDAEANQILIPGAEMVTNDGYDLLLEGLGKAIAGEVSASAALAEVTPAIQALVDDLWEQ